MIMQYFGLPCKFVPWIHGIIIADRLAKKASISFPSNTAIFPYTPIDYNALKELRLPQYQTTILIQLRSEHCPLNATNHVLKHYKYYKNMHAINNGHLQFIKCNNKCCALNNSGKCNYCNKIEDVYHYIINCKKYNNHRKQLMYSIMPIYLQYHLTISLKTILFPPKSLTWAHRKLVLQSISSYVINTDRFKPDHH
eukprot:74578_1